MNEPDHSVVTAPVAKATTAIVSAGGVSLADRFSTFKVENWADVAALAAAIYSLTLMAEWWWKRFWRPLLERRGYLRPRRRRASELDTDMGAL